MDVFSNSLGHIKKISVFRVTSLEIFGRVVTHIFYLIIVFYSGKKYMFIKLYFFQKT